MGAEDERQINRDSSGDSNMFALALRIVGDEVIGYNQRQKAQKRKFSKIFKF
jgi:hypothetical protein